MIVIELFSLEKTVYLGYRPCRKGGKGGREGDEEIKVGEVSSKGALEGERLGNSKE